MIKSNLDKAFKEVPANHDDDLSDSTHKAQLVTQHLSNTFLSSVELNDHIRAARALTVVAADCDFESYHEEVISDYMLALQLLLNSAEELCAKILKG